MDIVQMKATRIATRRGVWSPWWPRIDRVMTYQRMKAIAVKLQILTPRVISITTLNSLQMLTGSRDNSEPLIMAGTSKIGAGVNVMKSATARLATRMFVGVRNFFENIIDTMTRPFPRRPTGVKRRKVTQVTRRWMYGKTSTSDGVRVVVSSSDSKDVSHSISVTISTREAACSMVNDDAILVSVENRIFETFMSLRVLLYVA